MGLDGTSGARSGRRQDILDKAKGYQVVWNPTVTVPGNKCLEFKRDT